MKRLLLIVLLLIVCVSPVAATWWDTDWDWRMYTTVNTPPSIDHFQVYVNVTYLANMNADFSDLRFVDSDDTTQLPYYIENVSNGAFADVWVRLKDTGSYIYTYFGNAGAASESSAQNTFDLFDHFTDNPYNATLWKVGTFTPLFEYGTSVLSIKGKDNNYDAFGSKVLFPKGNYMVEYLPTILSNVSTTYALDGGWAGAQGVDANNTAVIIRHKHQTLSSYDGSFTNTAITGAQTANQVMQVIYNATPAGRTDGNAQVLVSSHVPTTDIPVAFWVTKDTAISNITLDWVRVRKYNYTPPTLSFGTPSEPPAFTCTANATCISLSNKGDAPGLDTWFKYGTKSGAHPLVVPNVTGNAGFFANTSTCEAVLTNNTYYVIACTVSGCGDEILCNTTAGHVLTKTTYAQRYNLSEGRMNFSRWGDTVMLVYTDVWGDLIWAVIWLVVLGVVFLVTRDMTTTLIFMIVTGGAIWTFIPVSWLPLLQALMVFGVAALVYRLMKGRAP